MDSVKEYFVKGTLFFVLLVFVIFSLGNKFVQKAGDVRADIVAEDMTVILKGKSLAEIKDFFASAEYDAQKYGQPVVNDVSENHVRVDFFQNKRNKYDPDKIYCSLDIYEKDSAVNIRKIPLEYKITKESFYSWPVLFTTVLLTSLAVYRSKKE